jgi:hypothetical protein
MNETRISEKFIVCTLKDVDKSYPAHPFNCEDVDDYDLVGTHFEYKCESKFNPSLFKTVSVEKVFMNCFRTN